MACFSKHSLSARRLSDTPSSRSFTRANAAFTHNAAKDTIRKVLV